MWDLCRLQTEMILVFEKMAEKLPVEQAGAVTCDDVSDDVGTRIDVVRCASDAFDGQAHAVAMGGSRASCQSLPGRSSVAKGGAAGAGAIASAEQSSGERSHRRVYPRVDAPPVQDHTLFWPFEIIPLVTSPGPFRSCSRTALETITRIKEAALHLALPTACSVSLNGADS